MAHRVRSTIDYDEEDTGGSAVVRFFVWAGLAAIAVGSVALAAQTQTGAERLARLAGHRMAVASPIQPQPAGGAGGAATRQDARGATGLVADEQAVESVATKT